MATFFNYAAAFSSEVIGETFNASVEHAANNGQIAHCLTLAASAAGIVIPAKPAKFIIDLNNNYLQTNTKSPKVAVVIVVQALYALASALIASGKVKDLPELAALPVWADPVALAAAKAAKAAKAAASKAAKAAETEDSSAAAIIAPVAAVAALAPVAALDLEQFLRAIRDGAFTSKELDQVQNALDFIKQTA